MPQRPASHLRSAFPSPPAQRVLGEEVAASYANLRCSSIAGTLPARALSALRYGKLRDPPILAYLGATLHFARLQNRLLTQSLLNRFEKEALAEELRNRLERSE